MKKSQLAKFFNQVIFFAALLAAWEILFRLKLWAPYIFPSPSAVAQSLVGGFMDGSYPIAIGVSMMRICIGFGISARALFKRHAWHGVERLADPAEYLLAAARAHLVRFERKRDSVCRSHGRGAFDCDCGGGGGEKYAAAIFARGAQSRRERVESISPGDVPCRAALHSHGLAFGVVVRVAFVDGG
jgi:hypothetical protein